MLNVSHGLSWEADELRKMNSNGVEYIHIKVATAGQFKATKRPSPFRNNRRINASPDATQGGVFQC